MPRVAPAYLFAMLLAIAGLALLVSGLAGQSRDGLRIVLSVLLLATALIVSGLQVMMGDRAGSTGSREGEGS